MDRSDDDLGRPHELTNSNHRGVGEGGHQGDLQSLERLLPLLTRDRVRAERVEIVGQQDRRGLGEPEDTAFAFEVLEGHHEDARRRDDPSRRGGARLPRAKVKGLP